MDMFSNMAESFSNNLIVEDRYRMILDGLQVTLLITLCAAVLGTILGGLVCWMRMSRRRWLQQVARVYIDLMRGTPVLVLLMLMYYVVMAPVDATGIVVAIVTFAMNTAAYISEMLRTTIQGIDRGQTEAGLALGFTPRQTFFKIVLPQVVKAVMPVYQGEIISLLKGTSIVGYIAVADMTRASDLIRSRTFDAFFPLIVTALIYFLMAWLIGLLLQSLVQRRHTKAIVAALMLTLFGLAGYVPTIVNDGENVTQTGDQKDIPPVFKALKGKSVGVIIGSVQDIAVTDMVPDADILRLTTQTDMLAALENGKVDVAGSESLTLVFSKEIAAKVDSVNAGMQPVPIAACFRLDNTELQQDFNSFLADIRRDGTYQQLYDRWQQAEDPSTMDIPQPRGTGHHAAVQLHQPGETIGLRACPADGMGQPEELESGVSRDGLRRTDACRTGGQGRPSHGSHQHHRGAAETGALLRRLYRVAHRTHHAKRGSRDTKPHPRPLSKGRGEWLPLAMGSCSPYHIYRWRNLAHSS